MRNLINFLLRHSSWIVLAIYVAISCVLLFGRNPYQRSIYLSSANQVAAAVYDLQSEVTSYFGLREVNRDLQLRNGGLEIWDICCISSDAEAFGLKPSFGYDGHTRITFTPKE